MLTYDPGDSIAHRLDPRSKLAVQTGFAAAAFAYTTPRGLAALSVLALVALAGARTSPVAAIYEVRVFLPFLIAGPLLEALTLGAPWFDAADAVGPALASYRILLLVMVSAAYVRTTPARASRAAIQWLVPGKPGRFLGMGLAIVVRFLPILQADLARARDAIRARCGQKQPVTDRITIVATAGLRRAFERADRLALALRARCLSWNATLVGLRFARIDVPALCLAAGLLAAAMIQVVW